MTPPPDTTLAALLAETEWVHRLARALASDASSADDLAQESWLAALRRPPSDAKNLRSWLAGLVHGKARDAARGDARRVRREETFARERGLAEGATTNDARSTTSHGRVDRSPEEALERAELVRALVEAVLALREPYKTALVLVHFEGLAPKDAAARLAMNEATLRSHVKRGLELVRERLDRESGGDRSRWFAGVAVLALEGMRGVRHVGSGAAAGAVGTGVLVMKTKLVVAVALVAVLAWFGWNRLRVEHAVAPTESVASTVELEKDALARLPELPATRKPLAIEESTPVALATAPTTGALELDVVFARDGRAAPNEALEVATWDAAMRVTSQDLVTDANGHARAEGLKPGTVRVQLLRGGSAFFENAIVAGETLHERVEIPRGIALRGRVETAEGKPAPGASIVVAYGGWGAVREIARADASGRFELADFGFDRSIGARLDGFAPSWMVELESSATGDDAQAREIVLTLRGAGGAVEGRVTDVEGRPIAGARVAIGPEGPYHVESEVGTRGTTMAAARTITDDDGRYRIDGLAPGAQDVSVSATGFPLHARSVDVPERGVATFDVVLARGGALAGRVLLEEGGPAANAKVQLDPSTVRGVRLTTDELGRFRVDDVAPGEHALIAGDVALGRKQAKVTIRTGEEQTIEIVLERGDVIAGRVVDGDGRALENWRVWTAVAQSRYTNAEWDRAQAWPPGWNSTRTDVEGRFRLTGLPRVAMRVEVRRPDLRDGLQPLVVREPVVPAPPGAGEALELRIESAASPASWIVGVATDADGKPIASAQLGVTISSGGGDGVLTQGTSDATGRFRIGPLPAGTYTLYGRAKDFRNAYLATAIVDGVNENDLGSIALKPAGRLLVTLARQGGGSVDGVKLYLVSEVRRELTLRIGDRFDSGTIEPGRYKLVAGKDGALDWTHAQDVVVREGDATETTIVLPAR